MGGPSSESHEIAVDALIQASRNILATGSGDLKAEFTNTVAKLWREQGVTFDSIPPCHDDEGPTSPPSAAPDHPARPSNVEILPFMKMPKRGKCGSEANRIAMLHSLAHIESIAIDLAWDIIARFTDENLPKEFYDDFVVVAEDEARHYHLLTNRLRELGSHYGALPAHDGLWDSATDTKDNILARLAIVHMVHEARGLDVTPGTIKRFENAGDHESATMLKQILAEEIPHVSAGMRWFLHICKKSSPPKDPISTFHDIVRKYFSGNLKPPFNKEAREQAGFTEEWYLPMANVKPIAATTKE